MPVLSFVDPFGYKGLTLNLIDRLIENSGSDCIFFFNYNRINMALSSNTKFDEYLNGLFGVQRTQKLKEQLSTLQPSQREPVVLDALVEALRERKGNYVLPFKFYSTEMLRTSHFIIFVTKHPLACKIMKQIMYTNSAKDCDGVATFSFEDSRNFGDAYQQISLFDRPLDALQAEMVKKYAGKQINVGALCNIVDCDFSNHYVGKNVIPRLSLAMTLAEFTANLLANYHQFWVSVEPTLLASEKKFKELIANHPENVNVVGEEKVSLFIYDVESDGLAHMVFTDDDSSQMLSNFKTVAKAAANRYMNSWNQLKRGTLAVRVVDKKQIEISPL